MRDKLRQWAVEKQESSRKEWEDVRNELAYKLGNWVVKVIGTKEYSQRLELTYRIGVAAINLQANKERVFKEQKETQ